MRTKMETDLFGEPIKPAEFEAPPPPPKVIPKIHDTACAPYKVIRESKTVVWVINQIGRAHV